MTKQQQRWESRGGRSPWEVGFTLVELMIVVVLIALLAGISGPTIASSIERNNLNQLNRDIISTINQARSHAMRNGHAVLLNVDEQADRIEIFEARQAGQAWDAPACSLAPNVGPNQSNRIAVIDLTTYSVDQELEEANLAGSPDVDGQAGGQTFCISPRGTVTDLSGRAVQSNATECQDMNILIPVYERGAGAGGLVECVDDPQLRADRELARFSMIHISYGGQARAVR